MIVVWLALAFVCGMFAAFLFVNYMLDALADENRR